MIHKSFKMHLYEGMAEEYERRHNLLWPEMKDMIHEYGGHNYSIFLDNETNVLFRSSMAISRLKRKKNGRNQQTRPSTANGGTIWLISWIQTRTTAR